MKINIIRVIICILLLYTFFIIFGFSSQNGSESSSVSKKVTSSILDKSKTYQNKTISEKERIFDRTEKIIRKIAHFSIYALVGLLLMGFVSTYNVKTRNKVIICLLVGILYAISDEIHQNFSPGRTPKITDVYIDTLGVIVGMLVTEIGLKIYKILDSRFCNKNKHNCHKMSQKVI